MQREREINVSPKALLLGGSIGAIFSGVAATTLVVLGLQVGSPNDDQRELSARYLANAQYLSSLTESVECAEAQAEIMASLSPEDLGYVIQNTPKGEGYRISLTHFPGTICVMDFEG